MSNVKYLQTLYLPEFAEHYIDNAEKYKIAVGEKYTAPLRVINDPEMFEAHVVPLKDMCEVYDTTEVNPTPGQVHYYVKSFYLEIDGNVIRAELPDTPARQLKSSISDDFFIYSRSIIHQFSINKDTLQADGAPLVNLTEMIEQEQTYQFAVTGAIVYLNKNTLETSLIPGPVVLQGILDQEENPIPVISVPVDYSLGKLIGYEMGIWQNMPEEEPSVD